MDKRKSQTSTHYPYRFASVILFVLIIIMGIQGIGIEMKAATLHKEDYWDWMFYTTSNLGDVWGPISRLRLDGREVFCVQVEMQNYNGDIYPDPIPASLVYDPDTLNRLGLITLFGFELTDKTRLDVAFTKLYVYESIGYTILDLKDMNDNQVFTMAAYEAYKAHVQAQIAAYMSGVSFHGQTVELGPQNQITLTDTNGMLDGYRVISTPAGVTASITGNDLILSASSQATDGSVLLQRSVVEQGTSLLYQPPGRQNVIESKIDAPRQSRVQIEITKNGGFTLNKIDKEGTMLGDAVFTLTGPDETIRTLTVPTSGLLINDLPAGDYLLEERTAPPGYRLDTKKREITIEAGKKAEEKLVSIVNAEQEASVRIVKKSPSDDTIAGARFEINRYEDFSGPSASGETNADGVLVFHGLSLAGGNTYYIRETFVPHPFVVDATVQSVQLRDGETSELVFSNQRKPWTIDLLKVNEQGQPIADAVFELSRSENFDQQEEIVELKTGEDGHAHLSGNDEHDPGRWYVREKSVPEPYRLDKSVHSFDLAFGETIELVFSNQRKPWTIDLLKVNEQGQPIANAVFELSRSEDFDQQEEIVELKTGEDGHAHLSGNDEHDSGRWYVREKSVPEPYRLDKSVHSFDLAFGETTELVFSNQRKPWTIDLLKINEQGQPIADAVFELSRSEDFDQQEEIVELKTGEDGHAHLSGNDEHDPGRWYVREKSVPEPYCLDSRVFHFDLEFGETSALEFINDTAHGRIHLLKRDAFTTRPLAHAVYRLTHKDGLVELDCQTDLEGKIDLNNLPLGEYELKEVKAPLGYVIDQTVHEINIDYADATTPEIEVRHEMTNRPILGRILINKSEQVNAKPIAGAVFLITDDKGVEVDRIVTDQAGQALSADLLYGHYTVRELAAPEDFYLESYVGEVFIERDKEQVQLQVTNERIELILLVNKVCAETNLPLAGAVFQVINSDGERIRLSNDSLNPFQIETDSKGRALADVMLGVGSYRLVEVSPPKGYATTPPLEFVIDRETETVELESGGRILETKVNNDPILVDISKVNHLDEPLSGALLMLADRDGHLVSIWQTSSTPHRLTRLTVGQTYVLSELSAPPGYALAPPYNLTVEDCSSVQHLKYQNRPTEVLIDKRDGKTNAPLPDIAFEIRQNGKRLTFRQTEDGIYRPDSSGCSIVLTDDKGLARIQGVSTGHLEISETSASGYRLDTSPRHIELTSDNDLDNPCTVKWLNDMLTVSIIKTDKETDIGLPGAVFNIKNKLGQSLTFSFVDGSYIHDPDGQADLRTNQDGNLDITGLAAGDYILHEKRAPAGYLPTDPVVFTISDKETADLELRVTNRAISVPVTGEGAVWPIVGTLFILNGAGLFSIKLLIKGRRQRRKRYL